jgi:hypothetical protein
VPLFERQIHCRPAVQPELLCPWLGLLLPAHLPHLQSRNHAVTQSHIHAVTQSRSHAFLPHLHVLGCIHVLLLEFTRAKESFQVADVRREVQFSLLYYTIMHPLRTSNPKHKPNPNQAKVSTTDAHNDAQTCVTLHWQTQAHLWVKLLKTAQFGCKTQEQQCVTV